MEFTSVMDVELLSVGMKWQSVNGTLTFTFDHLADAMRAANDDPHVVPPRLKIGHSDPRFADPDDPGHDPYFDGEPAFGSVRNLRLTNDGSILVGDYTDVPVWLAEVMPMAYPSRSIEGGYEKRDGPAGEVEGTWDVVTPGGKQYSFVLTACALLGLARPAVENLDDLRRYVTEGDGVVVAGAAPPGGQPVAASIGDMPLVPKMSADVEQVVDSFCAEINDLGPDDPRYWWWPIAMEADSGTVIADDDEGGLQAIPFTTDGDHNVTFADAYPVVKRYEAAPVAAAALAAAVLPGTPDVIFRSVAETPLAARHADRHKAPVVQGSDSSANLGTMDLTDKQRATLAAKLGLADDADETAIAEALDAAPVETPNPDDSAESDDTPVVNGDETDPADVTPPLASAATTVTIDKAVLDNLVANGKLAVDLSAKAEAKERGEILHAAVLAGKIMPSSKGDWEKKLTAAPEATKKEIDDLAEGLVPVTESGGSPAPVSLAANDEAAAAANIVSQWFGKSPTQEMV